MIVSQHTLRISRPRTETGPDDTDRERAALIPVFDRHGMAHPRVVRAKRRIGTAVWFKQLYG